MKKILCLAIVFFCVSQAAFAIDKTHKTVFDGETYYLAFSAQSQGGGFFNEYIRQGETLENWKKYIAVYQFPNMEDPEAAVAKMGQVVKARNPEANYKTFVKKDKTEAVIDFMIWTDKIAEFNVFRYVKKGGVKGLLAYQFAIRNYGPLTEDFKKDVQERQKWVNKVAESGFPQVLEYPYPQK